MCERCERVWVSRCWMQAAAATTCRGRTAGPQLQPPARRKSCHRGSLLAMKNLHDPVVLREAASAASAAAVHAAAAAVRCCCCSSAAAGRPPAAAADRRRYRCCGPRPQDCTGGRRPRGSPRPQASTGECCVENPPPLHEMGRKQFQSGNSFDPCKLQ